MSEPMDIDPPPGGMKHESLGGRMPPGRASQQQQRWGGMKPELGQPGIDPMRSPQQRRGAKPELGLDPLDASIYGASGGAGVAGTRRQSGSQTSTLADQKIRAYDSILQGLWFVHNMETKDVGGVVNKHMANYRVVFKRLERYYGQPIYIEDWKNAELQRSRIIGVIDMFETRASGQDRTIQNQSGQISAQETTIKNINAKRETLTYVNKNLRLVSDLHETIGELLNQFFQNVHQAAYPQDISAFKVRTFLEMTGKTSQSRLDTCQRDVHTAQEDATRYSKMLESKTTECNTQMNTVLKMNTVIHHVVGVLNKATGWELTFTSDLDGIDRFTRAVRTMERELTPIPILQDQLDTCKEKLTQSETKAMELTKEEVFSKEELVDFLDKESLVKAFLSTHVRGFGSPEALEEMVLKDGIATITQKLEHSAAVEDRLTACERTLEAEKDASEKLHIQLRETQSVLNDSESKHDLCKTDLESALDKISKLEIEVSEATLQLTKLIDHLNMYMDWSIDLEDSLEDMTDLAIRQMSGKQESHLEQQRNLQKCKRDNATLRRSLSERDRKLGIEGSRIKKLEEELRSSESTSRTAAEDTDTSWRNATEKLRLEKDEFKTRLDTERAKHGRTTELLEECNTDLATKSDRISDLVTANDELRRDADKVNREFTELKTSIRRSEGETILKLRQTITGQSTEIDRATDRYEKCRADLATKSSRNDKLLEYTNELRRELRELESELRQLQSQLVVQPSPPPPRPPPPASEGRILVKDLFTRGIRMQPEADIAFVHMDGWNENELNLFVAWLKEVDRPDDGTHLKIHNLLLSQVVVNAINDAWVEVLKANFHTKSEWVHYLDRLHVVSPTVIDESVDFDWGVIERDVI